MRGSSFSFFFSSRRRHTRCYSDWSSDVCSSDLLNIYLEKIDNFRSPLGLETPCISTKMYIEHGTISFLSRKVQNVVQDQLPVPMPMEDEPAGDRKSVV